jgi:hypothetical protein
VQFFFCFPHIDVLKVLESQENKINVLVIFMSQEFMFEERKTPSIQRPLLEHKGQKRSKIQLESKVPKVQST